MMATPPFDPPGGPAMSAKRPRLLDLFCCAGGAGMGYYRAGFDVTGVDISPQPNYPFEFHQADALKFVREHGHEFDAIHASPPCQSSCALTKGTNRGLEYPDLIADTRDALHRATIYKAMITGRNMPTVIENVAGAAIRKDVRLCGEMFGLRVIRHRFFELENWRMDQPEHKPHRGRVAGMRHGEWFEGPYFAVYGRGGGKGNLQQWREAMAIDWMTADELREAIPPAYTELLGREMSEWIK